MKTLKTPSEGYFLAKRQAQDSLEGRISVLNEKLEAARMNGNTALELGIVSEINIVEKIRTHLRNTLLWDRRNGK